MQALDDFQSSAQAQFGSHLAFHVKFQMLPFLTSPDKFIIFFVASFYILLSLFITN